jgi:hypothetical protein
MVLTVVAPAQVPAGRVQRLGKADAAGLVIQEVCP